MALDVEVPTPPDITNRTTPVEFDTEETTGNDRRRAELEAILRDGAWRAGFEEWAEYTDLSAADVALAETLGLFRAFDFFWDPEADRLRYVTPAVPAEWDDRAGEDVSSPRLVETEFDDLGRAVAETVVAEYVDWGSEESSDLVWGVETFGQVPTGDGE